MKIEFLEFKDHLKNLKRFEHWYGYFVRKNPKFKENVSNFLERSRRLGLLKNHDGRSDD